MIHEYPVYNMLELLSYTYLVTAEQLTMFFQGSLPEHETERLIAELIHDHRIVSYSFLSQPVLSIATRKMDLKPYEAEDRITAFWVIANLGVNNVRFIRPGNGTTIYTCILEDRKSMIDISVLQSNAEIQWVAKEWPKQREMDSINHIAVCRTTLIGSGLINELRYYGFKYLCIVNEETHNVDYYEV